MIYVPMTIPRSRATCLYPEYPEFSRPPQYSARRGYKAISMANTINYPSLVKEVNRFIWRCLLVLWAPYSLSSNLANRVLTAASSNYRSCKENTLIEVFMRTRWECSFLERMSAWKYHFRVMTINMTSHSATL